ncbi:hypothetical protein BLNAU_12186 [Blattamonas nauphoetae]|uniref:IPT/TIG domain-containing protein n=1 Tax=Blattamonas nauphoetae TaxID=2049346 RepID=A0ABQ9XMZ2_9EUKA|nr:hypothetical protein BLNAU_12186 [Blattamonas nauphoetae]
MEAISVIGTGLSLKSKDLIFGTGPLFSFGMNEHGYCLRASGCALRMETDLLSSTLVNVSSSSSAFSPGKQLFGSEVRQRVVGSFVRQSTNHDSGTGMISPNLGGNLKCLNTSFSSCVRQTNANLVFTNQNFTQTSEPGRLSSVASDVTYVSFNKCMFVEMSVSDGSSAGGAAIFLSKQSARLRVDTCTFHKCRCEGGWDNGGAIHFQCKSAFESRDIYIENDKFTDCYAGQDGGSVYVYDASTLQIRACFFDKSEAERGGSVYVKSETIDLYLVRFVKSDSDYGALYVHSVQTLELGFLHFRECRPHQYPYIGAIYFENYKSSQIPTDMLSVGTTDNTADVYFQEDGRKDSNNLLTQTEGTNTLKAVDVSFNEDTDEATVQVIFGEKVYVELDLLLEGSSVPRLIRMLIGVYRDESCVGTAVFSSGPDGVLPVDDYTVRSALIAKNRLTIEIGSIVVNASVTFDGSHTTEIVLWGANFEEGSYTMVLYDWDRRMEVNVSMTRVDSTTLKGTAPLHPSTAEGRLEWNTEYRLDDMKYIPTGQDKEKQVGFINGIYVMTPPEPARITFVDCALNGMKDGVVVELTGRGLTSDGQTLVVVSQTSNEMVSSGGLFNVTSTKCFVNFPIGGSESSTHVVFGGTYDLKSVGSGSSSILVDSGLFFEVPHPPRITTLSAPLEVSSSTFVLSVSGENLPSGKTFTVTLISGHSFSVTFSSTSAGTSTIGIGGSVQLQYNTDYTLKSVIRTVDGEDDHILLSASSFKTPLGPTLSSSTTPSETFPLTITSSALSAGFVLVEVYNKTGTLKYGTEYSIDGMNSSSVVAVVSALPFTTKPEPIRIKSASCSLKDDKQKSAVVTLNGVKLGGGKGFSVGVRKMEGSKLIGVEIELSGTLTGGSELTTNTHTELIFGTANPLLSFGTKYAITRFDVADSISVVDSDVTFSVPPEPARIVGIEKRQLNTDRTKMIVWLEGRALLSRTGKVNLTNESTTAESLWDVTVVDATHCKAEFAVGDEVKADRLKYEETYALTGSWTESSGFLVEDGITVKVPNLPKITNMKFVFSNTLHSVCFVNLTGTDLIVGESLNVTLNDSLSFIATVNSEIEAKSTELLIGWPTTLKHNTEYTITSIEATTAADPGKPFFDATISDTTGSASDPFVIFVDSGLSSDSTLFCGGKTRPCKSIEDGWKIVEGIGISSLSISIVHNTTQKEQVRMVSGHEVVIESLPTTTPELFVSPSSSLSEMKGEGIFEVGGGRLKLRDVDVVLSDSPSLIFVRMVGGHLTIETCTLASTSSALSNSDASLCRWSGGAVVLEEAT